jgi:hypothetical protein
MLPNFELPIYGLPMRGIVNACIERDDSLGHRNIFTQRDAEASADEIMKELDVRLKFPMLQDATPRVRTAKIIRPISLCCTLGKKLFINGKRSGKDKKGLMI